MHQEISVSGEGSYSEGRKSSGGVSEQHFSCGKERWRKPYCDKSEKTQCSHPLRALQNGRFALSEISSGTKRLPVQDRSQRRLLCNSSQQTVIKICEIQVVRQPLRVSLSLLWFRVSSKSFYQITKNPNCSFETNKHSNNCSSGGYVTDGVGLTGNYSSKGYIDFSVAKFRVCHKFEKVNLTPSKTVGISGVTDKYSGNDTVSLRRKTDSYNSIISEGLLSTQNFNIKFNKVNWPTFFNGNIVYIAKENSILFSPTGANIKSKKAGELPWVCYSWELSQTRTFLVDREHKTIQW